MREGSHTLIIRKMQNSRISFHTIRLAKLTKRSDNTNCWKGYGDLTALTATVKGKSCIHSLKDQFVLSHFEPSGPLMSFDLTPVPKT